MVSAFLRQNQGSPVLNNLRWCTGESQYGDDLLESLMEKLPRVPAIWTVVFVTLSICPREQARQVSYI